MKPKTIIILILIILSSIVLLQNTHQVTFRVLFWEVSISSLILLTFMVLFGFIIGYITAKLEKKSKSESNKFVNKNGVQEVENADE